MATVAETRPGFADKVIAGQSTFRAVMDAMARPGSVQRITASSGVPVPMMRATAAMSLALFDHDTPIWLDAPMAAADVAQWIRFHCSAPIVTDPSACHFALVSDAAALPAFDRFALGSQEYPDSSTTLIVQVDSLTDGPAIELRGPGIDGASILRATLGDLDLLPRLARNRELFPRGIDLVLVADFSIVAIPRTTRLAAKGA